MSNLTVAIAAYIAYLFGSFSSAIVVCKLMGLPDPRTQGSKNPGATNVLRIGGKKAAIFTLLGDMLKGFIPVLIANWYGFDPLQLSIIALCAFLGHLFPIFFRFDGGKGVATALGCYLGFAWQLGLAVIGTWLVIAVLFRYSSLAALVTFILAPVYFWFWQGDMVGTLLMVGMSLLLFIRHRQNIMNLYSGKETKIGK